MKFSLRLTALTVAALFTVAAQAETNVPAAVNAAVQTRIAGLFAAKTGMRATAIEQSQLPNFYLVSVDTNVFYVEKGGKWLFDGHLVDLDTRTSVTAQKKLELESAGVPALDWRSLNLADAVKAVRGKAVPGRVLVTFEDPNCTYCKKLHPELAKLDNITVYTFPIALLGPDSQAKNEAMWCSKDRLASWNALLTGQPIKGSAACDVSALARNGKLAQELKVRGTPTMFLADGSRVPGYMDAASIEARLAPQQK